MPDLRGFGGAMLSWADTGFMLGVSVIGFATCRSTGFVCWPLIAIEHSSTAAVRKNVPETRMKYVKRRIKLMLTRKIIKIKVMC
jgi:hypothetical protein